MHISAQKRTPAPPLIETRNFVDPLFDVQMMTDKLFLDDVGKKLGMRRELISPLYGQQTLNVQQSNKQLLSKREKAHDDALHRDFRKKFH